MKNLILLTSLLIGLNAKTQITEFMEREIAFQHFSGVVLVKKGALTIDEICYGQSDEGEPYGLDTPFDIGSISKQFTATAILQLVQNGKLQLNDPINQHLGAYASKRWKRVNIHHLLTHTSGIPSLFQTEQGLDVFLPQTYEVSRHELITRFKDGKLLFSPGEEFSYSNSGYILLAAIIEEVSGLSYDAYMETEIFRKNGLHNTHFGSQAGAALPYYGYRSDQLKKAPIYHSSWFVGAGGIYSSANDLAKWLQVINADNWLTPELKDACFQPHTRAGNSTYGYGWQIKAEGVIEHDGANAGFISFISFDPETEEQLIILTNRSFENIHMLGKSVEKVREWCENIWKIRRGESAIFLPKISRSKYPLEGHYQSADGAKLSVVHKDSVLLISSAESQPSRIITNSILPNESEAAGNLAIVADLLERGKYWRFAKYCDKEMTIVAYSGLMSIGFKMMRKQVGEMEKLYPYFISENHGLLRMKGSENILDLIVYFDQDGNIKGIFEHGLYDVDEGMAMIVYPTGDDSFYLDGFPYGEKDAHIRIREGGTELEVEQYGRTLIFTHFSE